QRRKCFRLILISNLLQQRRIHITCRHLGAIGAQHAAQMTFPNAATTDHENLFAHKNFEVLSCTEKLALRQSIYFINRKSPSNREVASVIFFHTKHWM